MKSGYILCLFFLLLLCRSEISGQILSPVLKKGEFEAGCTYKWFRRESEPEYICARCALSLSCQRHD